MATVIINESTPQGKQYLKYTRTLPFATVKREKRKPKTVWQQAIDEGAVTVYEFVAEAKRQIREHYRNA